MTKKIEFINTYNEYANEYNPRPASLAIPDWYKKMPAHATGKPSPAHVYKGKTTTSSTLKKCIPMFDALTAGYIITTYLDIYTKIENGKRRFIWADDSYPPIEFHDNFQFKDAPIGKVVKPLDQAPKFSNPFGIKTPKGYSTMFVNPMNHFNDIFWIFEGVVDTDEYISPVNFPFMFTQVDWEGTIPAGTPIAQVIPFKRDEWKLEVYEKASSPKLQKEMETVDKRVLSKFFNGYKSKFWSKKSFK